jgi:hypothetical protein
MMGVFDRPPLDRLPRFDDTEDYFSTHPDRQGLEQIVDWGTWDTGEHEFAGIERVVFHHAPTRGDLVAIRYPTDESPDLPLVLLARDISREEVDTALRFAGEEALEADAPIVEGLDWLLSWEPLGRGILLSRRRPYIEHPRQLLYG